MSKSNKKATFKNDGYIVEAGFRIRRLDKKNGIKYQVDLGRTGGKHVRKSFENATDARRYAQRKRNERKEKGKYAHQLTDKTRMDAMDALAILAGTGADLKEAARCYLKHNPQKTNVDLTLQSLVDLYLDDMRKREQRGDLRKDTIRDARQRLNMLCKDNGEMQARELTGDDLDTWLDEKGFKPQNRQNYKRIISVFLNWLCHKGYIGSNPVKEMRKQGMPRKMPAIWTAQETTAIFKAAQRIGQQENEEFVVYLACCFFGGLRPDEALRLEWEQIDLNLGEIHITPETSKTRSGRIVHMEPNLKEWLARYRQTKGRIFPYSSAKRRPLREEVLEKAGLKTWLQDGARHSYATYHLAAYDSIDRTVQELGHTSPQMLFRNYWGLAKNRDKQAEKYFSITPQSTTATITKMKEKSA